MNTLKIESQKLRTFSLKNLSNDKGMSLVQVMIAAGLMGGLSLVLANMMEQFQKTKKTAAVNNDIVLLDSYIKKSMSNPEVCNATYVGLKRGEYLNTGIKLNPGSGTDVKYLVKLDNRFGSTPLYIGKMRFLTEQEEIDRNQRDASVPVVTGDISIFILEVTVYKENESVRLANKRTTYGASEIVKLYPIPFKVADINDVSLCDTNSSTIQEIIDECNNATATFGPGATNNSNSITPSQPYTSQEALSRVDVMKGDGTPCDGGQHGLTFKCLIVSADAKVESCIDD